MLKASDIVSLREEACQLKLQTASLSKHVIEVLVSVLSDLDQPCPRGNADNYNFSVRLINTSDNLSQKTLKLLSEQKAADRMSVRSSWQSNGNKETDVSDALVGGDSQLKAMTAPYPELAYYGTDKVIEQLRDIVNSYLVATTSLCAALMQEGVTLPDASARVNFAALGHRLLVYAQQHHQAAPIPPAWVTH